ncbi:SH3 domain-containing protein [Leptospira yasudae]|uniref:SH3 domain-containing protein n=1 Tax=Leptospira yasudae TaxID=2202201 RepID=A0A6N4QFI6_9LEPT|nr:SH3 domain-containing protein [Leptospira yasudae]TGL79746.1 SH3 domain-containing protein [Leptospira yasudae]TGL80134.1 SH3 domain-containing protein [Leptospira yasudae]
MLQIQFLIIVIFLQFFLNRNLLSSEMKESCFTIYPNVLVRSTPSQSGKVVRKIEQSSLISIKDITSEVTKIKIRNNFIDGNWVKISDGWIFAGLTKCIPKVVFAYPFLYHGDELPFKKDELTDWIAIYLHRGDYFRKSISINVKKAHDPIIDENEKIKTGYKISANGDPIILIRGIPFKEGKFSASFIKKVPFILEFGKLYKFSYGTDQYILKTRGEYIESYGVKNYKLILQKNNQEMVIDSREKRYEMTSLIFAGDIDGDGELDFVFDLKDHYNVSNPHLYISSEKENDFFVVPVSANWTTGC